MQFGETEVCRPPIHDRGTRPNVALPVFSAFSAAKAGIRSGRSPGASAKLFYGIHRFPVLLHCQVLNGRRPDNRSLPERGCKFRAKTDPGLGGGADCVSFSVLVRGRYASLALRRAAESSRIAQNSLGYPLEGTHRDDG